MAAWVMTSRGFAAVIATDSVRILSLLPLLLAPHAFLVPLWRRTVLAVSVHT